MWRPGSQKPDASQPKESPENGGISLKTKTMKFMQRADQKEEMKIILEEKEKQKRESEWIISQKGSEFNSNNDNKPRLICLPDEIDILEVTYIEGRKSFGHFNKQLEVLNQSRRNFKGLSKKTEEIENNIDLKRKSDAILSKYVPSSGGGAKQKKKKTE